MFGTHGIQSRHLVIAEPVLCHWSEVAQTATDSSGNMHNRLVTVQVLLPLCNCITVFTAAENLFSLLIYLFNCWGLTNF